MLVCSPPVRAEDVGLTGNSDPQAQYRLGKRYYRDSCRVPARDAEALKWFQRSAEQGNAQAEERLGHIYFTGHCEPQDYAAAAMWYRRAAEHGDKVAQIRLAEIYRAGLGVPVDLGEAKRWNDLAFNCRAATDCFPTAVPAGSPSAAANDTVFTDNPDLRPAAEQGDAVAQYRLGARYYNELHRDPVRDAEALKWFRLSAAQGNAQAEARLGYIYSTGRGEPQDYVEGAMWIRRAAEHGDLEAQRRLVRIDLEGKGVPVDRREAKKWSDALAWPGKKRIYESAAVTLLGVTAYALALFVLQQDKVSGWRRFILAVFVHVIGIALVLNTLNTYGLPELLFPRCSYGYLAASCPNYSPPVRQFATWLRDWQTVNLVFRFMAMFGFVFDALAVWYVAFLCRPILRRRMHVQRT